jgi:hypothetical protein
MHGPVTTAGRCPLCANSDALLAVSSCSGPVAARVPRLMRFPNEPEDQTFGPTRRAQRLDASEANRH